MKPDTEIQAFLSDALPFIYRARLDGTIIFLEGGFHGVPGFVKTPSSKFQQIQEVLVHLSIDRDRVDRVLTDLIEGRSQRINEKVTIDVQGVPRRHLWIGTLSKNKQHMQGQLIDIENFEHIQDKFDRLRELTYGTRFLGERIATGRENARIRDLSIMFVDAVDSTSRIFSMEIDRAREYVEDLAGIITSVVKEYHGYVDKFTGDGAMVIWGFRISPEISCENHMVDSVLAAKKMLAKCKEYNEYRPEIEQMHIRIGIASGDVFSGAFENKDRMIFTSIGKPIYLAARLEKTADADSILIEHHHLLRCRKIRPGIVAHSKCSLVELKGIPEKIKACKIE